MMRFMVVDDSQVIRNQIQHTLSGKFEIVGLAKDGLEAMSEFRELTPEVVTMDLTMPNMDGIATIQAMMEIDSQVRILVVSALSDKLTALRALRLGAYGFLTKPFTTYQLMDAVEELISDLVDDNA
ncbi:MAG: two-component system chemotaxis response regulator CheY [Arenicella sp.]|jgi:two-component system chemotaxis response regulator CheY